MILGNGEEWSVVVYEDWLRWRRTWHHHTPHPAPQTKVAVNLQQGDGHKYNEVARDDGGPLEGKLENGRWMLTNTGKILKGNMRLAGDNRGKSVWRKGKGSGVTRKPGHEKSKYGVLNKEDKAVV